VYSFKELRHDPANQTCREVMQMAWDFFRADELEGFASALRRAWAYTKKLTKFALKAFKTLRTTGAQTVRFSSLMSRRGSMTKAEAYGRARKASKPHRALELPDFPFHKRESPP